MSNSKIKNIIFDIGNVLVKWAPLEAIRAIFPNAEPESLYTQLRPVWLDLNLGKINEIEAIEVCHHQLDIPTEQLSALMMQFKTTQTLIPGSINLLQKLNQQNYQLYSITDNTKRHIEYYKENYNFLNYFKDVIVSADIGILKPDPKIFMYLIDKHKLAADECIFIDDLEKNIEGAKSIGMKAILFTDAKSCREELIENGIIL